MVRLEDSNPDPRLGSALEGAPAFVQLRRNALVEPEPGFGRRRGDPSRLREPLTLAERLPVMRACHGSQCHAMARIGSRKLPRFALAE
jgi:hypothetical protein